MRTRQEYEELERKFLASYACKSAESLGRDYPEAEHPFRTAFGRDRDRIIHSNAFRRLEYKTQVFVFHEGDHYRTRLTHTLEGAQIARTIARALKLNEELAEAIILAHDLGHTPFGHVGQDVMNRLMKDHGGFEHNQQSLKIVTQLEKRYPDFPGLNLSFEVREGIAKHATSYDTPQVQFERRGLPSLEAQLVDKADEIAYSSHDLDDGIRSGLITTHQLKAVELWRRTYEAHPAEPELAIKKTVRGVINHLVTDLVKATEDKLSERAIQSLEGVRQAPHKCVTFSKETQAAAGELKAFLFENMYRHPHVERMGEKARRVIVDLFETYTRHPKVLPKEAQRQMEREGKERVICDYIAGMTDRFALEEHAKLFDPAVKV